MVVTPHSIARCVPFSRVARSGGGDIRVHSTRVPFSRVRRERSGGGWYITCYACAGLQQYDLGARAPRARRRRGRAARRAARRAAAAQWPLMSGRENEKSKGTCHQHITLHYITLHFRERDRKGRAIVRCSAARRFGPGTSHAHGACHLSGHVGRDITRTTRGGARSHCVVYSFSL